MSTQSIESFNYKSVSGIQQYLDDPKDWRNGQNCHSLNENETSFKEKKCYFTLSSSWGRMS